MKDIKSDDVQNRFTAYLQTAVLNNRKAYLRKQLRLKELELVHEVMAEKGYTEFELQLRRYQAECFQQSGNSEQLQEQIGSVQLFKAIRKLKERERRILFARVFSELSFDELGTEFDMTPYQAEMAYFYIVRKLRKKLEGYTR